MKRQLFAILTLIVLISSCSSPEKKRIIILYTADEHGWMNDNEKADGAAGMMALWKKNENFTLEADSFLVISGGDMWTGSSVSTWFKGRSMAEVMNTMGYDLAALGNHEFDFTLDTLIVRAQESEFPFLAANVVKSDNTIPCYVKPYTIIEANGVNIGVIGLANIETPNTASADAIVGLQFTDYGEAVKKYYPIVKKEGADVVIVVGHICKEEMEELAPLAEKLNIPLITGGHCHNAVLEEKNNVVLIETTPYLTSYIRVALEYDEATKQSTILSYSEVNNIAKDRDEQIAELVKKWEDLANKNLNIVLGYTEKGIQRETPQMDKLTTYSWLEMFEDADVAIQNCGGIRQDIDAGVITKGTILGLMPFNNKITKITLTGEQLQSFFDRQESMQENYIIAEAENLTIIPEQNYTVLTNDFLYALEETQFKSLDPTPEYLPMVYSEPSIQWLQTLKTSKDNPIEKCL